MDETRPPARARDPARPSVTRKTGVWAERRAELHLRLRGLTIVARNHRCRAGEIDLVALHGGMLVFVEVRYRASDKFGTPAATVHAAKQRRLIAAARHFLASHPEHGTRACRFDVVSLTGQRYRVRVQWIRNALYAEEIVR